MDQHHERNASQPGSVYLGLVWEGQLHGVLAWGSPVVNNAVHALGLRSRDALELRRMIVDDTPPRNSESRALGVSCTLIARQYPHLRVLLTYCGLDEAATAYRACGWKMVALNRNPSAVEITTTGEKMSIKTFHDRYGSGAERRVSHKMVTTPTQKLAYGLTPAVKARIDALHTALMRG